MWRPILRPRLVGLLVLVFFSTLLLWLYNDFAHSLTHTWRSMTLTRLSRHNGVIVMLLSPSRLTEALTAVQNVEDRLKYKYPYVLFSVEGEHFPDNFKSKIGHITDNRATFGTSFNHGLGNVDQRTC